MFPFSISSSYFEVVISFKPFNSTGAIPPFQSIIQRCFPFEWALTHRSFPRILPDSSNSPGVMPKFISKFDVRMNYHQSNVFLQDLSNSFIIDSTFLFFIMECLNNSWWCFSSSFSNFEGRRRISLQSYPFSQRFVMLACCHPLIIIFDCENSFHPSGAFQ